MKGLKSCWTCVLAVVAVGLCSGPADAQQVRVLQKSVQSTQAYIAIPGFYMLGTPHVQKELELVDEQKEKLRKISADYQKQVREAWTDMRNISAEDRKDKMAEVHEKMK